MPQFTIIKDPRGRAGHIVTLADQPGYHHTSFFVQGSRADAESSALTHLLARAEAAAEKPNAPRKITPAHFAGCKSTDEILARAYALAGSPVPAAATSAPSAVQVLGTARAHNEDAFAAKIAESVALGMPHVLATEMVGDTVQVFGVRKPAPSAPRKPFDLKRFIASGGVL